MVSDNAPDVASDKLLLLILQLIPDPGVVRAGLIIGGSLDHELEELRYAAKYPFTKAAKAIITSKEVNIDYEVMERASRRVSNGIIYENIPILDTTDKNFLMRELLS